MGIIFGRVTSETPPYRTLHKASRYEVRRYETQIAAIFSEPSADTAPTAVQSANKAFSSRAFRALAGYYGIMGDIAQTQRAGSRPQESISMTAPVVMKYREEPTAKDMQSMTFLLPASKYKKAEEVPEPTDERVRIVDMPERTLAVRVFTGNLGLEVIEKESEVLRKGLGEDGVEVKGDGEVEVAAFNPPFSLPWMKTNQVMIEVEADSVPRTETNPEAG